MAAKLQIISPEAEPLELAVGNTATIGRTRENTVCLAGNPLISRQHALIRRSGAQYQLIDLGSRNGTFVNGARVIMPVTLVDGAEIVIGESKLLFLEIEDDLLGDASKATMVSVVDQTGSAERAVALLICDIRGFTSMSERVAGEELAQFIGSWFRESGNAVHERGGAVDKFIGDAMLAYWGSAQNGSRDCGSAFAAARRLLALASARTWPGGRPFEVTIVLHYGVVTCSNVGIAAARDATIIGDAVNTVFRLEGVAKDLEQRILLSDEFTVHLPSGMGLEDFGPRELKGKSQSVRVWGFPNSSADGD